jgi:hypothetical protein
MKAHKVVPLASPLRPLEAHGRERPSLTEYVAHMVVERRFPYLHDLREVQQDHMIRRLQAIELTAMNTKQRISPLQCVQPMTVGNAPYPNCVSMLMQHATGCDYRVVPDVLWDDGTLRDLLTSIGVTVKASSECITASAKALESMLQRHLTVGELRTILRDWGIRNPVAPHKPFPPEDIFKPFHDLGVSLVLAAQKYGDRSLNGILTEIAFLQPAPSFTVCGTTIPQPTGTACKPVDMVRHKDAVLCFSCRRVADAALDAFEQIIPAPSTNDIIEHLFHYNLSGQLDPQSRLRTALAIDASLEEIYQFLARDRGHALSAQPRLLTQPMFAVPRRIVLQCKQHRPPVSPGMEQLDPDRQPNFVLMPENRHPLAGPATTNEPLNLPLDPTRIVEHLADGQPMHRRLIPYSCLIAASRIESVAPFMFQLSDFDDSPGCQALIRALPQIQTPTPLAVVRRIPGAARGLTVYSANARESTDRFRVYTHLLQLLVHAAELHRVNLADLSEIPMSEILAKNNAGGAPPPAGDLSTPPPMPKPRSKHQQGIKGTKIPYAEDPELSQRMADALDGLLEAEQTAKMNEKELRHSLRRLPLMLTTGEFAELTDCLIADSPGLIRRVNVACLHLVHSQISFAVCRSLGVPSMLRMIREEPLSATQVERNTEINAWNMMLHSSDFHHGLMRILETEALCQGNSGGTHTLIATTGMRVLRRPGTLAQLRSLSVERVKSIQAKITDVRVPTVNLAIDRDGSAAGSQSTAFSAFNPKRNTIYLVMREGRSRDGEDDRVNAPFRLAQELNRILGGAIVNIAPLAAMCSLVGQLGAAAVERIPPLLDGFDCINVDCAADGAVVSGNIVPLADVRRYGKCLLPDSVAVLGAPTRHYESYLDTQSLPATHVVRCDDSQVLRWRNPRTDPFGDRATLDYSKPSRARATPPSSS